MQTLTFQSSERYRRTMMLAALLVSLLALKVRAHSQEMASPAQPEMLLAAAPDVEANASPVRHNELKLSKEDRKQQKYDVARIGAREVGNGLNFYSMEAERMMGRQLADEIEEQAVTVDDPAVRAYIEQLCRRLVSHSDAKIPFTVKILRNDEINAFALPGGYFYVNSGLILSAENEAELAAVMAHEIAHVAARHASRNATRSQIWNLASLPMVFVSGPAGMALQQIKGFAVPLTFLKFSRDAEREADMLGLQYQYAAGYDPTAFVSFFERLNARAHRQGFISKAFSTHPMNEERIGSAQREIETMLPRRDEYVISNNEFEEAKARLAQIITGRPAVDNQPDTKPILVRSAVQQPAN